MAYGWHAGVDDFEHGFSANAALDCGKKPHTCTDGGAEETLEQMMPGTSAADRLIAMLADWDPLARRRVLAANAVLECAHREVAGRPY
jgi:hypothetical protein